MPEKARRVQAIMEMSGSCSLECMAFVPDGDGLGVGDCEVAGELVEWGDRCIADPGTKFEWVCQRVEAE